MLNSNYDEIYQRASTIDFNIDHRWAKTFKELQLCAPRYVNAIEMVDLKKETFFWNSFVVNNSASLSIPLNFFGVNFGYLFRGLSRKDFCIGYKKPVAIYMEEKYSKKTFKFGDPLVLVEGVLDTELIAGCTNRTVCAYLTSWVSDTVSQWLTMFTDKFVIIPDNDAPGKKNLSTSTKNLTSKGASVVVVDYPSVMNDPAKWVESRGREEVSNAINVYMC